MKVGLLALAALVVCACGGGAGGKERPSASAMAEGKTLYEGRCVPCHGVGGKGDGPASGTLDPKPRNFADKAWQGSVTDEHIEKIIVGGGPAVGKNAAMPPNPDLEAKPHVVKALKELIRGFSGK